MTPNSKFKIQNSKFHNLAPHALSSIAYSVFFFLYFASFTRIINGPDIPWHLKAGELIRSLGFIPKTDPWAYTTNGEEWFNISWLFDVIISFINDFIGIEGLITIFAIIGALIIGGVANICLKRGANVFSTVIVILITGFILNMGLLIRPHIITLILAVYFFNILLKSRETKGLKNLLLLPIAMILWVNMHGGFLLGFLFLGAFGVEAILLKQWSYLKNLFIISAICIIALFINPLGWNIIPAVLRTLNSDMAAHINEWRATKIFSDIAITLHFFLFLITANRNKQISIAEQLICLGMLLLGLYQVRNYIIFALISCPFIALNLSSLIRFKIDESFQSAFNKKDNRIGTLIIAAVLTLTFSIPYIRDKAISNDRHFGWQENKVPFASIKFIEDNYSDIRFYNRYGYGGYLIYFSDIPVFIDGRERTAYPKELIKDFLKIATFSNNWEKVIEKYNIGGIFLPNDDWRNEYFQNSYKWQKVFEGDVASLYIKTELVK